MAIETRDYYKEGEKGFEKPLTAKAITRKVRISPFKARLVADLIRGKKVSEAFAILQECSKRPAKYILKTLKSAVANAEHNFGLDPERLVITEIYVNEGPTFKRFRPRAQGRAYPIRRRTSHIYIEVGYPEAKKLKK